jgi:hypothetical protein
MVTALIAAAFAAVAFFFSIRWMMRRRALRQRGIPVQAEITESRPSGKYGEVTMYTVAFTTNDGHVLTRQRQDAGPERVTHWVYDPERPETAWQAHNLDSRTFSFLIWGTFGLGVLFALLAWAATSA